MQLVGTADNNSPVSGSVGGDNSSNNNNKNVNTATSLEATNDYIDDGTTTTRTTNFSTVDRSDLRMGFGVTREDLFRIASKNIPFHDDATNDDSQWKMEMKKEFQTIVSAARGEEGTTSTNEFKSDAQEEEDLALLENSLKYIGVPVLMKDADGDILGTWAHKADEMRFSGLKIVPEGSLQFAFERESKSSSRSN